MFLGDVPDAYPSVLLSCCSIRHTRRNPSQSSTKARQGRPPGTGSTASRRCSARTGRKCVLLLEGINDMNINGASPAQVAINVQNMVQIARLYNCTVLVATMPQTYPSTYPAWQRAQPVG